MQRPISGLKTIIAVHSTARGPASGGCRYWHYASDIAALHDAMRLSQGMILVNAGGIISVAREWLGQGDEASVTVEVMRIGERPAELIDRTHGRSTAPAREAENWARSKLVATSRG